MRKPVDPYLKVVQSFNKERVRYVLIGVSAVNYYAKSASHIILTGDFDIFVEPDEENVFKAAKVLWGEGFNLFAGGRSVRKRDKKSIEKIVQMRQTIHAENPDHNVVELSLNVSGFTFEELCRDTKIFRAGKIKVCVARLKKLLKMKEIADRPKDRLFLERFKLA